MRRLLSIGIVATISLLAMSPSAPASTSPTPHAMKTVTIKSAGIALRYPSTWTVLSYKGLTKTQKKAIAKANPKLSVQAQNDADSQTVKDTKFYARDLAAEATGQFASNLGVQVVGGTDFPPSLGAFKQVLASGYKQIGATVVRASRQRVGGQTAFEATVHLPIKLPDGSIVDALVGQLFVRHGDGAVEVSVASSADPTGTGLIQAVLASVRNA